MFMKEAERPKQVSSLCFVTNMYNFLSVEVTLKLHF
jgi:hypothetical protein